MNLTFRPIGNDWQGEVSQTRRPSPFKAEYMDSERLLRYEVGKLDGDLLVVQIAVEEVDLKADGRPRMRAAYAHPGVIVSFESRHGPLRYSTDAFDDWRANLRAVALGLEALRKVDRYGITRRGEQYTGWRQIEAPGSGPSGALAVLLRHAGLTQEEAEELGWGPWKIRGLAVRRTHPDVGGSEDAFNEVQEAWRVLGGAPSGGGS